MIQEFVNSNRKLISFYSKNVLSIGQILVFAGLASIAFFAFQSATQEHYKAAWYKVVLNSTTAIIFPGIITIMIAKICACLLEPEKRPHFLLRHGDVILYLYAAALVSNATISGFSVSNMKLDTFSIWAMLIPAVLGSAFKAFVIAGLGPIIRKLVPAIQESMETV